MSEVLTSESCFEALKAVIDPEIYQNIVDLGLVYGVDVQPDDTVDVTMTLTTPHCPMGPQIIENVEEVLLEHGAATVNVHIVWEPMWTPDAMTDELKRELGMLEDEEPVYVPSYTPPPPPPKKKGFFGRLFGG
ncbi:MAG: metal-sulfur cluster assembly factor [Caldilineaceae bacterium]|nr:metal-sulfur cluster assembly factor [Caldilineaceae bacterium]